MSLNIANIDKLLAFMRALPPEHFSMEIAQNPSCETPGCIAGCAWAIGLGEADDEFIGALAVPLGIGLEWVALFTPAGWTKANKTGDFPLARAIDVVQHLRDTGEVDWARFPAENYRSPLATPKPAWTPPVVIAVEPELPESLTSLLRQPVEVGDG